MTLKTFIAGDVLTASDTNTFLSHTGDAWDAWTPTRTGLTLGNGTEVSNYWRSGRLVVWRYSLVFGSTTSITGNVTLTLPVSASTNGGLVGANMAPALLVDTGTADYVGLVRIQGTTTAQVIIMTSSGTYPSFIALSSTVPHTWANTDIIRFTISYEAAAG